GDGAVWILSGQHGDIEWQVGRGYFDPGVGAIRVTDLDVDGRPDLYVAGHGCSAGPENAYAFTFHAGFGSGRADAATTLWELEAGRDYACGTADVVADVNGDHLPEIITFGSQYAYVYDGRTGRKIASGDALGVDGYSLGFSVPYGVVRAEAVDVDGDGAMEIIGFTNNAYQPSINSRSIFLVRWDATRPQAQRMSVIWRESVPVLSRDRHAFVDDAVADLDHDGTLEVTSTFVIDGTPSTRIWNARTGALLGTIADAAIAGVLRRAPGDAVGLLLQQGSSVRGVRVIGFSPFSIAEMFVVADANVALAPSLDRRQQFSADRALVATSTAAGSIDFPVTHPNNRIELIRATSLGATTVGMFDRSPSRPAAIAGARDVQNPGSGYLVSFTDGIIAATDDALRPTNLGGAMVALAGIHSGGFYAGGCRNFSTPIVPGGAESASVIAANATGSLVRIDPRGASLVLPPATIWNWSGAYSATASDLDGDGVDEVVALTDRDRLLGEQRTVEAWSIDRSTRRWAQTIVDRRQETFLDAPVPSRRSRGSDVGLATIDFGDGSGQVRVLAGADGSTRFASVRQDTVGASQGILSAFSRLGRPLVAMDLRGYLNVFDAVDGTPLGVGEQGYGQVP
ncbi:MAG: VCBS repeat-containing protein, partial [Deltaproteobacteria bacterium]